MAWSDEPWILNGAAVRISIIGFDKGEEDIRTLDGVAVIAINADLTSATDITVAHRLPENVGIGFQGFIFAGPFDMDESKAKEMLLAPLNPNGRPNSDVIKPMVNGLDITRRPRHRWAVDFGVGTTFEVAAQYELPFEYVKQEVYPKRLEGKSQVRDSRWWLYLWSRPDMRVKTESLPRFIVTPAVSKHRLFAWQTGVVANHALNVFARDDDYFFGMLHSRPHEVWSLRMGTWLGKGNDPRYTPTTCFETFPLPWPPGSEPVEDARVIAIGEAAKSLNKLRENWLNPEGAAEVDLKKRTLTNLYNVRPQWLVNAHAMLDRAVWDAYGWDDPEPPAINEDVILSRLLALNVARSGK